MISSAAAREESTAPRLAERLPLGVVIGTALVLWRLFYPGLLSTDSIAQYAQARAGLYNNWHPPLMAITLHAVLWAGGTLGLLMLGQCLALLLGVRALGLATLDRVWGRERLAPVAREWAGVTPLLLLLLPWTPLAPFAMTFWKDVWAAAALLWMCALLLAPPPRAQAVRWMLAVTGLGVLLGLARHNAVIALVPVGALLALALRGQATALRLGATIAPLLGWWLASATIERAFHVKDMHPSSQIMALDLVGLCAESAAVCDDLPWTKANVIDPASLARYRPGDLGFIAWDQPPHVSPRLRFDFPRLEAEYRQAILRHPLLLAGVKLRAYEALLGIERTEYFFHDKIVANPFGLGFTSRFADARAWLTGVLSAVRDGWLRWLSGVHLVWLLANLLAIAVAASFARRRSHAGARQLALVLVVPLFYALSYLAATPVHDFRFLYPATLATQCVLLAFAAGWLAQMPAGRAPSRSTLRA